MVNDRFRNGPWLLIATGLTIAFFGPSNAVAEDPADFPFRLLPHDGRPRVEPTAVLTANGLLIPAAREAAGSESLSWYEIAGLTVVPPVVLAGSESSLVIDDDGRDRVTSNFGKIKLRKGMHRFHLVYASRDGIDVSERQLQLDFKAPEETQWTEVPAEMLRHQPHWYWAPETRSTGFDDEGFRVPDQPTEAKKNIAIRVHTWAKSQDAPTRVEDIRQVNVSHWGSIPKVRVPDRRHTSQTAAVIYGLFNIPVDGEYRFRLKSDGVSALFVGDQPPRLWNMVLPWKKDEWDAELAYGGRIVAPIKSFEDGIVTFAPRHGPSDYDEASTEIAMPVGLIRKMRPFFRELPESLPESPAKAGKEDVLFAEGSSGSSRAVSGEAVAIRDGKFVFLYGGAERTVPLDRIEQVCFAESEWTSAMSPDEPVMLVRPPGMHRIPAVLVDGSDPWRFRFAAVGIDPTTYDQPGRTFLLDRVVLRGIDVVGGGSVNLADLQPMVTQTALFDLAPPLSTNMMPNGERLKAGRTTFESGFAMGPSTSLRFPVRGSFGRLNVSVAAASQLSNATARIRFDDQVVWDNSELDQDVGVTDVSLELDEPKTITFEVDFGPQFDVNDLIIFGDPELIRIPPETELAAD